MRPQHPFIVAHSVLRGLNVLKKARSIHPVSVSCDRLQTSLADSVAAVHSSGGRTEGSVTDKMVFYMPESASGRWGDGGDQYPIVRDTSYFSRAVRSSEPPGTCNQPGLTNR